MADEVKISFVVDDNGAVRVLDHMGTELRRLGDAADRATTQGRAGFAGWQAAVVTASQALNALRQAWAGVEQVWGKLTAPLQQMEQINAMAQRMGIAVESLSTLGVVAEDAELPIGQLAAGMRFLARAQVEAREEGSKISNVLKALNVDARAFADAKPEEAIMAMAGAMGQLEDGTRKMNIAREIFGRGGMSMITFLNLGEAGIRSQVEWVKRLGLAYGTEAARAADQFNDSLTMLGRVVDSVLRDAMMQALPHVQNVVDEVFRWIEANRGLLVQDIAGHVRGIATSAGQAAQDFLSLSNSVRGFVDTWKALPPELQWAIIGGAVTRGSPIGVGLGLLYGASERFSFANPNFQNYMDQSAMEYTIGEQARIAANRGYAPTTEGGTVLIRRETDEQVAKRLGIYRPRVSLEGSYWGGMSQAPADTPPEQLMTPAPSWTPRGGYGGPDLGALDRALGQRGRGGGGDDGGRTVDQEVADAAKRLRESDAEKAKSMQAQEILARAVLMSRQNELGVLQQQLTTMQGQDASLEQQVQAAARIEGAEQRVLLAQRAQLEAQLATNAAKQQANNLTGGDLQVLRAEAQVLRVEMDGVDAKLAEGPRRVQQITEEFKRAHTVVRSLGDTLNSSIQRAVDGLLTGQQGFTLENALKGTGQALASEFIGGLLEAQLKKNEFDVMVTENFTVKLPGVFGIGAKLMSGAFDTAFTGIESSAASTAAQVGGTLRNVPGVGNIAALANLPELFGGGSAVAPGTGTVLAPSGGGTTVATPGPWASGYVYPSSSGTGGGVGLGALGLIAGGVGLAAPLIAGAVGGQDAQSWVGQGVTYGGLAGGIVGGVVGATAGGAALLGASGGASIGTILAGSAAGGLIGIVLGAVVAGILYALKDQIFKPPTQENLTTTVARKAIREIGLPDPLANIGLEGRGVYQIARDLRTAKDLQLFNAVLGPYYEGPPMGGPGTPAQGSVWNDGRTVNKANQILWRFEAEQRARDSLIYRTLYGVDNPNTSRDDVMHRNKGAWALGKVLGLSVEEADRFQNIVVNNALLYQEDPKYTQQRLYDIAMESGVTPRSALKELEKQVLAGEMVPSTYAQGIIGLADLLAPGMPKGVNLATMLGADAQLRFRGNESLPPNIQALWHEVRVPVRPGKNYGEFAYGNVLDTEKAATEIERIIKVFEDLEEASKSAARNGVAAFNEALAAGEDGAAAFRKAMTEEVVTGIQTAMVEQAWASITALPSFEALQTVIGTGVAAGPEGFDLAAITGALSTFATDALPLVEAWSVAQRQLAAMLQMQPDTLRESATTLREEAEDTRTRLLLSPRQQEARRRTKLTELDTELTALRAGGVAPDEAARVLELLGERAQLGRDITSGAGTYRQGSARYRREVMFGTGVLESTASLYEGLADAQMDATGALQENTTAVQQLTAEMRKRSAGDGGVVVVQERGSTVDTPRGRAGLLRALRSDPSVRRAIRDVVVGRG